jgi:hypothetical protein
VIHTAVETCWRIDPDEARIVVIPNTLEVKTLWVSPAMEHEVRAHPYLTRETEYTPMPIGDDDSLDLVGLFPDSVRARRQAARAHSESVPTGAVAVS